MGGGGGEGTRNDTMVFLVDTGGNDCKWEQTEHFHLWWEGHTGHSEGYNSH